MFHYLLAAEKAEVIYPGIVPFVTSLVVFSIVVALFFKFIWPQIAKGLEERENKLRQEIRSAEEAREQAKSLLGEYERNLAQAREEANQMIAKARADAKAVAEELRSRNEADLTEMKTRAAQEIDSAKRAAINELYAEAATLATAIASRILEREINADDQRRLVDDSLRELVAVRTD